MRLGTVYERNGKLYVDSSSKTTAGVWVINGKAFAVEKKELAQIGRLVKECLAASREGVPHPTSFSDLSNPLLRLAGIKSFKSFAKSTRCVTVLTNDDTIVTLEPTRNGGGVKSGFRPLREKSFTVPLGSGETLGSAVLAALAMSEIDKP